MKQIDDKEKFLSHTMPKQKKRKS